MGSDLIDAVRRFVRRDRVLEDREPLHVGVSGGVDSMVLLHVLRRLGHVCSVIHVDHGTRGEGSAADRRFVEEQARALGLEVHGTWVDAPAHAARCGISVQMAARELRYACFEEVRQTRPWRIALAHHADDAVETLFINLLRGTGVRGWAGIRPVSGPYVRPLLHAHRSEIMRYAEANGIAYREDPSNADPKYLRNRIRHEVLPLLETLRPGASQAMARSVALLRELAPQNEAASASSISFALLEQSGSPTVLLHEALYRFGFHPDMIERIRDAVAERRTGAIFEAGAHRVVVDRDELRIGLRAAEPASIRIDADHPSGEGGGLRWRFLAAADAPASVPREEALLDAAALHFPLQLRPWRPGDRMRPTGLGGSKLISDILIDAKVPRDAKDTVLVLESGGRLAWLVGFRIGEGFQATSASERVLHLQRMGS